ncbi:MAG TPA: FAD/NAD(P)-binding protein [Acidimicrobiia bacterium]|nr:FAD/NAD(P)-binding protein [Acidimicrobiia bacterium]
MTTVMESRVPVVGADPMLLRPFRVFSTRRDTADTVTLELVAADGGAPLVFRPGQFTMMYVYGVGEVPISIAGNPATPETLVHTVRAVGAVTNAICALERGETIGIRGPYGTHWPIEGATDHDVIIVAGGIGIAPVRPAIHHLMTYRPDYGSVSIVYGSRSPADLLYTEDIHRWRSRFDTNVQVTVDRADDSWLGDVGVVTPMLDRLSYEPGSTAAIVCGPEIMMRIVARELVNRGVSADQIWVSLERNLKCGLGYCGHCQIGPAFVCKNGPVVSYQSVSTRLGMEEL